MTNANCAAGPPMDLHAVPSTLFAWRRGALSAIQFRALTFEPQPTVLR